MVTVNQMTVDIKLKHINLPIALFIHLRSFLPLFIAYILAEYWKTTTKSKFCVNGFSIYDFYGYEELMRKTVAL